MYSVLMLVVFLFHEPSQTYGENFCCPDNECYSMDPPWRSVFRPVPNPTCVDDVEFLLFTRSNPGIPFNTSMKNMSLDGSYYSAGKATVILLSGWLMRIDGKPWASVGPAILSNVDANVIYANYSYVTSNINYPQVVSDIRRLATLVCKFVSYLIDEKGVSKNKIHLVGMSLGSHVASYVGKCINDLGRITGLDPAGPLFNGFNCTIHLCKGDAQFVDAIHTNGNPVWGFGTHTENNDVDINMNGGWDQPLCGVPDKNTIPNITAGNYTSMDILKTFMCSHLRAIYYYVEALRNRNCTFWGQPANMVKMHVSRNTLGYGTKLVVDSATCTNETCAAIKLDIASTERGQFIVATNYLEPYCVSAPEQEGGIFNSLMSILP
ncbi:Pancreatic lipase-related protein 3 [Zootermopsis nevadensis]|uniref:Pancreatic lipase-related protein 3 n=3 Tax=Zootermopsis nevadensis TaxID=136037 RepID=A0A067QGT5_ZOONE|nr:Pancreatic lipase-related protein 3 [Zootermopsis nevadensis]